MRIAISLLLIAAVAAAQAKTDQLALLEKKLVEVEARLKVADQGAKTALDSAKLEKIRAERDKLRAAIRKLKQPAEKSTELELPDIAKLLVKAKKGDVPARNALLKLRSQIDGALKPPVQQNPPIFFGNGRIIMRRGGALQVMPGRAAAVPVSKPPKSEPAPKPLSEEERKRLLEIDITDQEMRARELEESIVELTRRALELERRIADLRAQVAAAEKR
ncbi:MAG: hypothetical protein ACYS0E_06920 [Planctomycetota bacterium]|jgi:hypothetical protein